MKISFPCGSHWTLQLPTLTNTPGSPSSPESDTVVDASGTADPPREAMTPTARAIAATSAGGRDGSAVANTWGGVDVTEGADVAGPLGADTTTGIDETGDP
jgi:hypothetical protein